MDPSERVVADNALHSAAIQTATVLRDAFEPSMLDLMSSCLATTWNQLPEHTLGWRQSAGDDLRLGNTIIPTRVKLRIRPYLIHDNGNALVEPRVYKYWTELDAGISASAVEQLAQTTARACGHDELVVAPSPNGYTARYIVHSTGDKFRDPDEINWLDNVSVVALRLIAIEGRARTTP